VSSRGFLWLRSDRSGPRKPRFEKLEGNVVSRCGRGTRVSTRRPAPTFGLAGIRLRFIDPLPPGRTQELYGQRVDFGGAALLAFFVLPLASLQAPFDVDRTALREVLTTMLSGSTPDNYSMPFSLFDLVAAILVRPVLTGREAEIRNRLAVLRVTEFGVSPEVADQNDLVDACHMGGSPSGLDLGVPGKHPRVGHGVKGDRPYSCRNRSNMARLWAGGYSESCFPFRGGREVTSVAHRCENDDWGVRLRA